MPVVVVASSDARRRRDLVTSLEAEDFQTIVAEDGFAAFRAVFESAPDAALIDLKIEGVDGIELVRMLRAASDLAIIAIAPSADAITSVQALETGADDVVRSSTTPGELAARLRASIRRSRRMPRRQVQNPTIVETGDLVIDRATRTVTKHGKPVALTRTEYRLLDALALRIGQASPHRYLLSSVWGDEFVDDTHYLRVYVGYLRGKLEDHPSRPTYIVSEWGVGYRLVLHPPSSVAGAPSPGSQGNRSMDGIDGQGVAGFDS